MKEIWKDIKGYEGYYQISSFGRVKSMERIIGYNHSLTGNRHYRKKKESILKLKDSRGYNFITISKDGVYKNFRVCRLVAQHFIENNHNKKYVNHIDGNKKNDNVSNLEWVTASENMAHALKNGLLKPRKGKDCSQSIKVYCAYSGKEFSTIREASDYCGVSSSHLSRMLNGIYTNKTTIRYA